MLSFTSRLFRRTGIGKFTIMIRRVALLFAITGVGHLINIFGLKYLASVGRLADVAQIGEVETLIQTLIYVIGFGIQTEAIRNTAFTSDWKSALNEVQTARVTLSILVLPAALLVFYDWTYACFLIAPILASSSDYALYARGYPVTGAMIAFLRAVIPLVAAMAASYAGQPYVPEIYLGTSALVYLTTNFLITGKLRIPHGWKPAPSSLKLFAKTLPIGIINLGLFFFGLGILFFARFFVTADLLAVAYMALKFYVVYKGAIRVVHQGFMNQMKDNRVCYQTDQIAMMLALFILGSTWIFPQTFIGLFFGSNLLDRQLTFLLLGISTLVYSLFSSVVTRALLERQDRQFLWVVSAAVCSALLALVLSTGLGFGTDSILFSVLIGELFFSIGAAWQFITKEEAFKRVVFLIKCLPTLVIPFLFHSFFQESILTYGLSFMLMGLVLLLLHHRALTWRPTESIVDHHE